MNITKTLCKKYFVAFQHIAAIRRFSHYRIEEFIEWQEGEGKPHVEAFLDTVQVLPQARLIEEDAAKAWIWAFYHDPETQKLSEEERRSYLIGACGGLRKLSAYDAAIVTQELDNPDTWSYAFKSAEAIRRGLLLKDMYSTTPAKPESRLREFARPSMRRECWLTVHEANRKNPGYIRTEIMESRESDWVSAYGQRYAFLREEYKDKELWHPCLLVADDDKAKEAEFFYELGGVAAALPNEYELGDCVICIVSPRDYTIHAKLVPAEKILEKKNAVNACVERFWNEYVLTDTPLLHYKEKKLIPLDADTLEQLASLYRDIAAFSIAKKRCEAAETNARKELSRIARDIAFKERCSVHDLDFPKGLLLPVRGMDIQDEELQYMVDTVPGAGEAVFSKISPDTEMMVSKLKEIGVDERHWCVGVPDVKSIQDFCERNGYRAPLKPRLSFVINSRSADGKQRLDGILDSIAPQLEKIGVPVNVT